MKKGIKTEKCYIVFDLCVLRIILIGFLLQIVFFNVQAQSSKKIAYTPAKDLTIVGKIMPTTNPYYRVNLIKYANLPKRVTMRMKQSGGLAIAFNTNSKAIYAKWCTDNSVPSAIMSDVAYRGLDLYIKKDGKWQWAGIGRPRMNKKCLATTIIKGMNKEEKECLLYLPLYASVEKLEIGVHQGVTISASAQPFKKRILVYGSSITQGAAASRPGLAYPARLSRSTGLNFLNLGMGGSAQMEKVVADMIADIDADAYILDCVPNSSPTEIRERSAYLIKTIHNRHKNVPIIVMQSVIRESGNFKPSTRKKVSLQNQYIKEEVEKLQKAGMKNLYFIPADDFLGHDHEGTVDGTHPNDMGIDRMIGVIRPRILKILKKYGIDSNK